MPTPRLIDLYKAEMSLLTATNARKAERRNWFRAVVEELNERSLTCERPPFRRHKADRVERVESFWRAQSDEALFELLDYLAPYFRRPANRMLPF